MQLSVLLATRNNASVLSQLLYSLTQCRQPESWELVVVDNGSTDNTAEVVRSYVNQLSVIYTNETIQGKSRALNHGLSHVRGEIILFTDDDITPDMDWLVNIVHAMDKHTDINVLGGRICVDARDLPVWLANASNLRGMLVAEHDLGTKEVIYGPDHYPFGPNMAVRRCVLATLENPWPTYLGPGTPLPLGDEMVFVQNLKLAGQRRLYSPDCIVRHKPIIRRNYLLSALKRTFIGGFVAGYYGDEDRSVQYEKKSFLELARTRITASRSAREIMCILTRYGGHCMGRIRRSLST